MLSRIFFQAIEELNKFITECQLLSEEMKLIAKRLLVNQQGGILKQMSVSPKQPLHCRTITSVVVHATAVFSDRQKVDLLLPFVNMLKNPAALNVSHLHVSK